ncbi:MAG: hypothetical protein BGO89_01655 [Candidatus Kapaibacterium thiocyanatum]|uniref:Uncharacterized protein n=1 Tax=Candidatus Kapaibacterium thiocyanatum TaxID=1895771 RepID=A0A1M3L6X0_9BACT|nr:MAG: hypothetical protein BGO89_01655 ['Candidatus Kapabacteria' thiocyanatum]
MSFTGWSFDILIGLSSIVLFCRSSVTRRPVPEPFVLIWKVVGIASIRHPFPSRNSPSTDRTSQFVNSPSRTGPSRRSGRTRLPSPPIKALRQDTADELRTNRQ